MGKAFRMVSHLPSLSLSVVSFFVTALRVRRGRGAQNNKITWRRRVTNSREKQERRRNKQRRTRMGSPARSVHGGAQNPEENKNSKIKTIRNGG